MRSALHMGLNGAIAGGELSLTGIKELEVLLQDEEMFGPIVPGEGSDDVGLGGAAPIVTVLGQLLRVAVAGHDVAQDT